MPRIARGLYASHRERAGLPEGGLDLREIVKDAARCRSFERLFGESTHLVDRVAELVQRRGWMLNRTEIVEAVEEFA